MAASSPTSDILANVMEPRYRSATEKRIGGEIMALEGTWDEKTQTFRTKETVLQRRTHTLAKMQLTLRVSPQLQYANESADINFVYPQCPRELLRQHKTKPSDLGLADPCPENIERCASQAAEQRARPTPMDANRVGTDDAIAELEQELMAEARKFLGNDYQSPALGGRGGTMTRTSGGAYTPSLFGSASSPALQFTAGNQTPTDKSPRSASHMPGSLARPLQAGDAELVLPDIGSQGPHAYSSLLVELQTTRRNFKSRGKTYSALQNILEMDASADLKRTITRMFADPKRAQQISDEEQERRDKKHVEERRLQTRQQMALLMEERALLDRELAMLR